MMRGFPNAVGSMDISIRGLDKRWDRTPVFSGLDLDIAGGECVALVGRSGAGKSTLLHLIAGIDRADAGSITLGHGTLGDGKLGDGTLGAVRLETLDDDALTVLRRRRMGLVFQSFNLVPSLSALDNVRLPLELVGHRPEPAREQARALLRQLDLEALTGRYPEQLSGGEQQRVAVARALAHGPGLVLADEPTGSLDFDSAGRVLDLLVGACRQRGVTLVMASHSQDVMGRADRVLRLGDGRLAAD